MYAYKVLTSFLFLFSMYLRARKDTHILSRLVL